MKEFSVDVRVIYADTDQMGVVYYGNYFRWLEIARTEFFRFQGFDYRKIEKEEKIALPVVEAYCRYKSPARYDDIIQIKTKMNPVKNSSLRFDYELINKSDKRLLATAHTVHVFIDEERRPIKIPERVLSFMKK